MTWRAGARRLNAKCGHANVRCVTTLTLRIDCSPLSDHETQGFSCSPGLSSDVSLVHDAFRIVFTKAWRDVIEDRVVTLTRVMHEASLLVNLHFARVRSRAQSVAGIPPVRERSRGKSHPRDLFHHAHAHARSTAHIRRLLGLG